MLRPLPRRALHLAAVAAAMVILLFTAEVGPPYDFCTYYTAGDAFRDGDLDAVYDFDGINARHGDLHPREGTRVGTFVYSPIFLLPATLLARLDFGAAQVVNQVTILLALSGLLLLLLERADSLWLKGLIWLAFVVADPVTNQFLYQNWSAPLALFLGLALVLTLAGRTTWAALFWALAIHLKAYLALFLLPLAVAGNRRLVGAVVVAGLALAVLSLPWVGVDGWTVYAGAMREQAGGWTTYFFNQVSLQSTIARFEFEPREWLDAPRAPMLPLLEWIFWLSLPAWGYAVCRLRHDRARALALTIPYLLLFVPKIWDHTQILFFALLLTGVLVRRTQAMLLAYLLLSWAYFPLVQHLLREAVREPGSAAIVHATLVYYPLLNLLALAAVLTAGGRKSRGVIET